MNGQGRWQITEEKIAIEAFLVLIKRDAPTKRFTRKELTARLVFPDIYGDFLKYCIEYDDSNNLTYLKKGLKLVITSIGPSQFAEITGLSRMTIHRILAKDGNPRLNSLLSILKALGLRIWLVDSEFIQRRTKLLRPKNVDATFSLRRNARFFPKFKIDRELDKLASTQRIDSEKD